MSGDNGQQDRILAPRQYLVQRKFYDEKKKKNGNSKFKKKIHPVSKDLRTSTHCQELHIDVCHGHKRNIITDLLLTGLFLVI